MEQKFVRGIVPLLGLIVPLVALGFALRKGGHLTKSRSLSDKDRLSFY
jgi:hypothetical protein